MVHDDPLQVAFEVDHPAVVLITHEKGYFRQISQQAKVTGHCISRSTMAAASGSAWKLNSAHCVAFPFAGKKSSPKSLYRMYYFQHFYLFIFELAEPTLITSTHYKALLELG